MDLPSFKVDFTLKREQCYRLFPSGSISSQLFCCAGQGFFLSAHCNMEPSNSFGLLIEMLEDKRSPRRTMAYTIQVKIKSLQDFVTVHKGTFTSDSRDAAGCNDLFGLPWSEFITDNSPFFIDDKLHLRVFAVMKPQP
jgi:hypothetical protein